MASAPPQAAVDPEALRAAHDAYAAERDAAIPADHAGPRPSGGVGGTRTGVKCLHAHYAHLLAGGDDPVGRWAAAQLASADCPEPAWATDAPAEGAGEPGRRGRHRDQLDAPARRRRRRHRRHATPSSCPSTGACASPASARASTAPARSRPRRSSAPSRCCASTAPRSTSTASRGCAPPRRARRVTRRTATSSSPPRTTRSGVTPELLSGRGRSRALVPRCHRRPRRAGALPRRRHRRWLHRVRARHRRAGRPRLARHRVRADHRAVPALRPARARGAVERGRGRARPRRRRARASSPARPTRRRSSDSPGTVTTVAAIELGLPEYDPEKIHHFRLTRAAAEDVFRTARHRDAPRSGRTTRASNRVGST